MTPKNGHTKTQTTPRPWEVTPYGQIAGSRNKIAYMDKYFDNWQANAQHIVKCVNIHDELMEALKSAISLLDIYKTDGFAVSNENVNGQNIFGVMKEIQQALKKAEG